jgi:hypothetical protein
MSRLPAALQRVLLQLLVHLLGDEPHVAGRGGQVRMAQGCLDHFQARLVARMRGGKAD